MTSYCSSPISQRGTLPANARNVLMTVAGSTAYSCSPAPNQLKASSRWESRSSVSFSSSAYAKKKRVSSAIFFFFFFASSVKEACCIVPPCLRCRWRSPMRPRAPFPAPPCRCPSPKNDGSTAATPQAAAPGHAEQTGPDVQTHHALKMWNFGLPGWHPLSSCMAIACCRLRAGIPARSCGHPDLSVPRPSFFSGCTGSAR